MTTAWALGILVAIIAAILRASHHPSWQRVFRWLPLPLWCYALPAIAVACGILPQGHPAYRLVTDHVLPLALGLLLFNVNLPAVIRTGRAAFVAAGVGAMGIVLGASTTVWLLRDYLPSDAWKGAGTLAGTWTGGTMNLLALRSVLDTPERIFAPLIIVDAMIAYSWMALLVAASGFQRPIDRWLRAQPPHEHERSPLTRLVPEQTEFQGAPPNDPKALVCCALLALGLALCARLLAPRLPTSQLVSSATGWSVILVTTVALTLSFLPPIRRLGAVGNNLGYPCLYLVLAATGAQASLEALWSAPVWIVVGIGVVAIHATVLLLVGRLLRIPLGVLATASQANIGGVVSAPLVGAIYHQSLMPVGLLLAMVGNALGTYLGWYAALLCLWLLRT